MMTLFEAEQREDNLIALRKFNEEHLGGDDDHVLIDGRDIRQIDVVRGVVPFHVFAGVRYIRAENIAAFARSAAAAVTITGLKPEWHAPAPGSRPDHSEFPSASSEAGVAMT
jgi:hypothetical protein